MKTLKKENNLHYITTKSIKQYIYLYISHYTFKQKEIEVNCEIFNGKSERCVVIVDMC